MVETAYSETKSDRILLFVHGCDFKPEPGELLDICIAAVKAGINRDYPESIDKFNDIEKRLAYYGDVTNAFFEERGRSYDATLDVGDRRNALQSLSAIDKRKNFGVHRYDRVPGKTAVGEFAASVVGPVLGRLGMSKAIISKLCVDLGEYWNEQTSFDESLRARVRDAIVEALNSDKRLMLLSHGTGCVVAYDVLWELSNDPKYSSLVDGRKVDTWLTAGAPLGDSLIRGRLKGANVKGPGRYPSNIVSWYNVSAEDDYLCHDNTLADDFRPMLKQKQVSTIKDYRIYNLAVRYGKSNPHSSIGYLIHPRIANLISTWLD